MDRSSRPPRTGTRIPSKPASTRGNTPLSPPEASPTRKSTIGMTRTRTSGSNSSTSTTRSTRTRTTEQSGNSPYGVGIGHQNNASSTSLSVYTGSSTSLHTSLQNRSPCPSPIPTMRPNTERLRQNREDRHARAAETRRHLNRRAEEIAAEYAQIYKQMINEWRESQQRRLMERVARGNISEADAANLGIGAGDGETLAEENQRIKVYVRLRPMSQQEVATSQYEIITIGQRPTAKQPYARLFLHEPKTRTDRLDQRARMGMETHTFRFDDVFDSNEDNAQVYATAVEPLVRAMEQPGARVTLFAYGQTGSGKTHTMFGSDGMVAQAQKHHGHHGSHDHKHVLAHHGPHITGIHEMVVRDLFALTDALSEHIRLVPYLCFFEIHQNKIHDLLQSRVRCTLRSDRQGRTRIVGLREVVLESPEAALEYIREGSLDRTVGATGLNAAASRSHAVVQITLCEELPGYMPDGRRKRRIYSRFSLVDLAGSERAAEAKDASIRERVEGGGINRSLLALKECIRALSRLSSIKLPAPGREPTPSQEQTDQHDTSTGQLEGNSANGLVPPHSPALSTTSVATSMTTSTAISQGAHPPVNPVQLGHVPFRASQLTLVLKDSLISPEARTAVISCISPASGSVEHTANTLRYSRRVKTIRVRRKKRTRRRLVRRLVRRINDDNEEEEVEVEMEVEEDDDTGDGTFIDESEEEEEDDEDGDVDLFDLDDNQSLAGESLAGDTESILGDLHRHSPDSGLVSEPEPEPEPEPELTPEDWLRIAIDVPLPGNEPSGVKWTFVPDADEDLLTDPQNPTGDAALDLLMRCHRWALEQGAQKHDASYRLLQSARFKRIDQDTYVAQLETMLREKMAIIDALSAVVERHRRERAAEKQRQAMLEAVRNLTDSQANTSACQVEQTTTSASSETTLPLAQATSESVTTTLTMANESMAAEAAPNFVVADATMDMLARSVTESNESSV